MSGERLVYRIDVVAESEIDALQASYEAGAWGYGTTPYQALGDALDDARAMYGDDNEEEPPADERAALVADFFNNESHSCTDERVREGKAFYVATIQFHEEEDQ